MVGRTTVAFGLVAALVAGGGSASAQTEHPFEATDVGAGGWLHSGAFHPTDPDVILVGTDRTGGIYRTDDFGLHWYPWNEGLANYDEMDSMYVDDLVGVVEPGGAVAFYAATFGGIYRAAEDGAWDWMADDPLRSTDPEDAMIHWRTGVPWGHREPISFSSIDWNGDDLLVAGAGRVRWNNEGYETDFYPTIPLGELRTDCASFPELPCNTALRPVWFYDLEDPDPGWRSFDGADDIGTPRDVSVAKVGGMDYVAVATRLGLYLYDVDADSWTTLSDNPFWSGEDGEPTIPLNYGTEVSAWSIHLTARGSLYVAMQRLGEQESPSGVYRIHDVVGQPDGAWVWVGDGQNVLPHADSMWTIGMAQGFFTSPRPALIYLTVVDGSGGDPDTLFLGSRETNLGLFRGTQPYLEPSSGRASWASLVTRERWATPIHPAGFDLGWITIWGLEVLFHPAVMSGSDPPKLAVQFNGRMHVSGDGGTTWHQRYVEGGPGAWTSRGYNQHSVRDVTFFGDGRAVLSAADTGVFVSTDDRCTAWDYIQPEVNRHSTATDDTIKNLESNAVQVRENWLDEGRDALFINYSDVVQQSRYGKLFRYREPVPPSEVPEWNNITKTLDDLPLYLFRDFTFSDDSHVFLTYTKYTDQVGEEDSVVMEYGVLKGVLDEGPDTWSWETLNAGLPEFSEINTFAVAILYNAFQGERLFLATTRNAYGIGGLYVLENPNNTEPPLPVWQAVYDESPAANKYRDFRALAQSADHSWVYAGTRGKATGIGGLLLCKDPSASLIEGNWEILANDPENTIRPFQFYLNNPFWEEDWEGAQDDRIDQQATYVYSLEVDPQEREIVYLGLLDHGFTKRAGLWRFDGIADEWTHLSRDQVFEGMAGLTLGFNPHVNKQLFLGTDGQGLYFRDERGRGDFDDDGDVDLNDYSLFASCYSGPGGPWGPGCGEGDFDADDDIDCEDWFRFKSAWTEPEAPPGFASCPETVGLEIDRAQLSWTVVDGAGGYDVVSGDLGALRGSGGNFTAAVDSCLADNREQPSLPYTEDPPAGDSRWFLVRGVWESGRMTYGSPERDAEIDAAPSACQ